MGMLADDLDHVIGVDTHGDAHSAAIVAVTGVVVAHRAEPANPFGYKRLLRFVSVPPLAAGISVGERPSSRRPSP
jgi:hypothetical protein